MLKKLVCLFLLFAQVCYAQDDKIVIVRHGEGTHNIDRVYNSSPFHPNYRPALLTEKGREQVAQTAEALLEQGFSPETVGVVVVSPLPRTLQTARILMKKGVFTFDQVIIDARLKEPNWGDLEGQTTMKRDDWNYSDAANYGGETNAVVRERVLDLCNDIESKGTRGHVLLITHGIPSMELIEARTGQRIKLPTAEAYILDR